MLKYCKGCFTQEECIIQEAIIKKIYTKKCPCENCLVKMTCDDKKPNQVCNNVMQIVASIREYYRDK